MFVWDFVTPYSAAVNKASVDRDCACRAAQHGAQDCTKAVHGQERSTGEEVSQDLTAGARGA